MVRRRQKESARQVSSSVLWISRQPIRREACSTLRGVRAEHIPDVRCIEDAFCYLKATRSDYSTRAGEVLVLDSAMLVIES